MTSSAIISAVSVMFETVEESPPPPLSTAENRITKRQCLIPEKFYVAPNVAVAVAWKVPGSIPGLLVVYSCNTVFFPITGDAV
jgi:hypothetical protein